MAEKSNIGLSDTDVAKTRRFFDVFSVMVGFNDKNNT